jgi:hypothetical protein
MDRILLKLGTIWIFVALPSLVEAQAWQESSYLVASDIESGNRFGYNVSIDGNYAIIGAPLHQYAYSFSESGTAYIFKYSNGGWSEMQKLVPADTANWALFGESVSISGNFAIVGSRRNRLDHNGQNDLSDAGAAYIFQNVGGTWIQFQKLIAGDRKLNQWFGSSVAISGNIAVVGAVNDSSSTGSAYIFEFDGNSWIEVDKILASDRMEGDEFGFSVAISGNYTFVGARHADSTTSSGIFYKDAGAVYIFEKQGNSWNQSQKIRATQIRSNQDFGWSVHVDSGRAIVGAPYDSGDENGVNPMVESGSAIVFEESGGVWYPMQKLVANDRSPQDRFGFSVSISNNYAIVGAEYEDHDTLSGNYIESSGSAYVFGFSNGNWNEMQKLVSPDRGEGDFFGSSVGIYGQNAIVGCYNDDLDSLSFPFPMTGAGSAYMFHTNKVLTSFNENNFEEFILFPNPARNYLRLKIPQNQKIANARVISLTGKVLLQIGVDEIRNKMDLQSLNEGMYLLVLEGNDFRRELKFVKE